MDTLNKLYVRSANGQTVPLSAFAKWSTAPVQPLSISHQSQFPAVTISFNLAQGAALGQAVDAINAAMREMATPLTLQASFQGTAQAFQSSLASQPYLIAAALITVYIILGILYESYILPLTILSTLPSAGVGALLMLMLFRYELTVIALIGIILLIGIVKKNGIMMVDFAINAERRDGADAAGRDPSGLPAAVPADLDDHDGGDAVRHPADAGHRRRVGTAPAAGLRDGGRAGAEPDPDALHHAGDLSVSGYACSIGCRRAGRACRHWRRKWVPRPINPRYREVRIWTDGGRDRD